MQFKKSRHLIISLELKKLTSDCHVFQTLKMRQMNIEVTHRYFSFIKLMREFTKFRTNNMRASRALLTQKTKYRLQIWLITCSQLPSFGSQNLNKISMEPRSLTSMSVVHEHAEQPVSILVIMQTSAVYSNSSQGSLFNLALGMRACYIAL